MRVELLLRNLLNRKFYEIDRQFDVEPPRKSFAFVIYFVLALFGAQVGFLLGRSPLALVLFFSFLSHGSVQLCRHGVGEPGEVWGKRKDNKGGTQFAVNKRTFVTNIRTR